MVPEVEQAMIDSGILLLKYWLEVTPEEQTRRLQGRINDARKVWKLSDMDLESYGRWYDYSRARDDMFATTDTAWAPWFVAHSDDKKRGRLNIITHLLEPDPLRALGSPGDQLAQAAEAPGPTASRTSDLPLHPDAVLSRTPARSTSAQAGSPERPLTSAVVDPGLGGPADHALDPGP